MARWFSRFVRQRQAPASNVSHVWSAYDGSEVRFLFQQRQQRLQGAFGVSVLSHVAVFFLAIFVASQLPDAKTQTVEPIRSYEIVWLPEEGPGGGGGGGGNESPEPPRQVELPGPDPISVPVEKPPEVSEPEPEPEDVPKPEQELVIPAETLGAGETTIAGVLEGLPTLATGSQGTGTGGGGGTGSGTGIGSGTGSGLGPGTGGGSGGGVYRPGSGVTLPRVLREVKPQYTADAMRAKVQGTVWLEAVVQPDGTIGDVRVVKSLDKVFGLDEEAIKAARQWRFVPGSRMGEPVPVLITIELTFTLR